MRNLVWPAFEHFTLREITVGKGCVSAAPSSPPQDGRRIGKPPEIGIAFGAVLGGFNGVLVASARVPAFVITLGMMYVYRGILASWAGSKQYFSGNNPAGFNDLSTDTIASIPIITIIALAVVVVMAVCLGCRRSGSMAGKSSRSRGTSPVCAAVGRHAGFAVPARGRPSVFNALAISTERTAAVRVRPRSWVAGRTRLRPSHSSLPEASRDRQHAEPDRSEANWGVG